MPEFSVPILDPYTIEFREHSFKLLMVTGKVVLRNVTTYGVKDAKFSSVKSFYQNERHRLEFNFVIPRIFAEGNFKASAIVSGSMTVGAKGKF